MIQITKQIYDKFEALIGLWGSGIRKDRRGSHCPCLAPTTTCGCVMATEQQGLD